MVERSDRAPLLDWEEVPSAEKDRQSSPSNSRALSGSPSPGFGWSSSPGGPTPTPSADGCSAPPATSSTPVAGTDETLHPDKEGHPSDSGPREVLLEDRMVKWEEKDQIVSVFVVTFNTRSGGGHKYIYIYIYMQHGFIIGILHKIQKIFQKYYNGCDVCRWGKGEI